MLGKGTTALRRLLATGDLVVAPGAYDPYTARIIESLGFPAVYLGGNAIGTQLCVGEPLTTLTETVDAAERVLRVIDVPLIVDGNAGFGDAIHAFRTVREFESVGVAGIHIEDQPFPKRAHYHRGQGRVTEMEEVLERMQAAIDARRDPDFVLIGRTDVLRTTGRVADVLERCRAYLELGLDMIMVIGPPTVEQARELTRELKGVPQVWLSGTAPPDLSVSEVRDLGYALVIFPVTAPVVITEAVVRAYTTLRDTGSLGMSLEEIASLRKKNLEILGMDRYWAIEEKTTERA
jgi:methylisocitrate lyase